MRRLLHVVIFCCKLLLPSWGLVFNITVEFTSPVNEGDDVEMTCAYIFDNSQEEPLLQWRRKRNTDPKFQVIWRYYGEINSAVDTLSSKLEYIPQTLQEETSRSHKIKLLDAKKNDAGLYKCSVSDLTFAENSEKQLDVVGPCDHITCINGECVPSNDSFDASCQCSYGYTGQLCDSRVNPCDEMNPCVNGRCVASDDFPSTLCECPADYTGDVCDVQQVPSTPVPTTPGYAPYVEVETTPDKGKHISSAGTLTCETLVTGLCTAIIYIAAIW